MTTSFCPLRWAYSIVDFSGQEVRSCSKTPPESISSGDIDNLGKDIFLNTQFQLDRRLGMLNGERHSSCDACWAAEDAGIGSMRLDNRWFPEPWRKKGNPMRGFHSLNPDSVLKNVLTGEEITPAKVSETSSLLRSDLPVMLELNLSNVCDLKCSYCGPEFSSKWETETDLWSLGNLSAYEKPTKKNIDPRFEELFWEWFNEGPIFSVMRLGVIGGEPFINPRLQDFLNKFLESYQRIPLEKRPHSDYFDAKGRSLLDHKPVFYFVTNLNLSSKVMDRLTNDILPRLLKVFHVEIHASLESVGKKSEYIRYGLNWETFKSNAERLCALKLPGFSFGFQPAINSMSISSLPDFLKFAWSLHERFDRPIILKQNLVLKPENHHPAILTPDFAVYVRDALTFLAAVKDKMPAMTDESSNWGSYSTYLESLHESISSGKGERVKWEAGSLQEARKNFSQFFQMYDEKRGTKFLDVFPEYAEFYKLCRE